MSLAAKFALTGALISFALPCAAIAQGNRPSTRDSASITQLDTVVVTPERSGIPVREASVSVSAIPRSWIRALPLRSTASALAITPGVAVIDVNSLGGSPRVIVRGFYGGGETDYLPAEIDGVPIAALGTGAVDWDMLPASSFSRVEVLRGASSYLHGDAAVGGALDAVTMPAERLFWRGAGGPHQLLDAALDAARTSGGGSMSVDADHKSAAGLRHHEERSASTLRARIDHYGSQGSFAFFGLLHHRQLDDPGPLPSTIADREAANPFFRFDRSREWVDRVGANASHSIGSARASGYLVGEWATANTIKTLPLSPDFADTKLRRTTAPRALTSAQLEVGDDEPRKPGRIVAGIDASMGRLSSRYSDIVAGDEAAYAASDGEPAPAAPSSRATRNAVAGFLNWQLRPVAPVRLSLGARYDRLSDSFDDGTSGGGDTHASHDAFSPRLATNVALPVVSGVATNAYVAWGRAFKAPTLDQLFDTRAIPIPVPPFSATVSNPDLVPQRGTSVEGGVYQTWTSPGGARIDLSGAVYSEKMRDELDFDVSSFRYVNIGRSLHRGVELGLTAVAPRNWLGFASFARQRVTAEAGQFDGKQLKAIPRTIASAGFNAPVWRGISAGLVVTSVAGAYVDDQNLIPLAGYTRLDARAGIPIGPVRMTLDLMNALDRHYDATAFPDPAGSAVTYRYPAAGRTLILGVERR
jgi:outer membrane receptor protein involved in Fe transport